MTDQTIIMEVMRYRPEQDKEPWLQSFTVPYTDDMSILQGLQYIKDYLDESLSFRWSCRMAICGSCGMMVDGTPQLACKTFLRNYPGKVRIEALHHFPIERDLVIVLDDFMEKLERIKPYIVTKGEERPLSEGENLQTPAQMDLYHQFSACINCLLCYAACPQYGLDSKFLGPGAVALMHRYNQDSRDEGAAERMEMIAAEDGVFSCTAVGYCSEVCPKHVDPANAVNQNKTMAAKEYFLRFVKPSGSCK